VEFNGRLTNPSLTNVAHVSNSPTLSSSKNSSSQNLNFVNKLQANERATHSLKHSHPTPHHKGSMKSPSSHVTSGSSGSSSSFSGASSSNGSGGHSRTSLTPSVGSGSHAVHSSSVSSNLSRQMKTIEGSVGVKKNRYTLRKVNFGNTHQGTNSK
jgi:hypothetical protein